MKKFNFIFALLFAAVNLPAAALDTEDAATEPAAPYSSKFYQDFVTAAWQEKQGGIEAAFEIYKKLDEILPGDYAILKSISNIAIALEDQEAMDAYIPQLIKIAPDTPETISIRATWHWSKGELQEAAKQYERAIKADPENPEIIFKYVTLLAGMDSDKAIEYLEALGKDYPRMTGVIALQIAELYLKDNDQSGAIAYLEKAVNTHPQMAEPYLGLARIYEYKGDVNGVINQYLAMETAGLADAEVLTKIGAFYVLKNEKEASVEYFLKAKDIDYSNPAAAQFLVLHAQEKGDYMSAIKYLTESRDYSKSPSAYVRVSYFYNRLGDLYKASQVLEEARTKFESNQDLDYYYALSLMDLNEFKKAQKVFEGLLKNAPENQTFMLQYAFALERQKKYKDMERVLKSIIEAAPENVDALNFLGYYLVDRTKRYEEGGEYIKKAVALAPKSVAFIDSLAWYYYKTGDYIQAKDLIEGIKDSASGNAEIILHLGNIYEALQDYPQAAQYYNALLEFEPDNKEALKGIKRISKK